MTQAEVFDYQEERFNPFPGLRPFEPDEDHLFFGRETATDDLLRKLRTTRFLAVIGRAAVDRHKPVSDVFFRFPPGRNS